MNNKKGLGKGLAALIGEAKLHFNTPNFADEDGKMQYIKISDILPNKDQPRKNFDPEALSELAESIKENGVLQPIMLQKAEDHYRIIAGERRWRASKLAGLNEIPAIIKNYDDSREFEIALIENIQRQDLNIMEEAVGYLRLAEEFGYTQEQIAKALGKSRSYIANILRLNTLPQSVQEKIATNQISMGHAKPLIGLDEAEQLANIIIEKGLNVRQAEQLAKNHKTLPKQAVAKISNKSYKNSATDPEIQKLQENLSEKLGTKVVFESYENGGKIVIFFENIDELDEILNRMS